jgi:aspartate kinase
MKVFKFGGASVKDADAVSNMCFIVASYYEKGIAPLVVVSAMGKTTNRLEEIWQTALAGKPAKTQIKALKSYHEEIAMELFGGDRHEIFDTLDKLFFKLDAELPSGRKKPDMYYDQIVSYGEIISTHIIAAYLNYRGIPTQWLDARRYIQTDEQWRQGKVDFKLSRKLIQGDIPKILEEQVVVTQGFIGSTVGNKSTTLGREGSDYSAAIFAYCLDAESVTIWKDVPGILNADPRRIKDAKLFSRLSYRQAAEMTYYGATVIHPKTIKPLLDKQIPLYVRSFIEPKKDGTCIEDTLEGAQEPAFIFKQGQCIVSFTIQDLTDLNRDRLNELINYLRAVGANFSMLATSAFTFRVVMDENENLVKKISKAMQDEYLVEVTNGLEILTIMNYEVLDINETVAKYKPLLEVCDPNKWQLVVKKDENFISSKA